MSLTLHTATGAVKIELRYIDNEQVKHVENFVRHCAQGTYNNNKILRYIPKFILQTGDATNTGKVSVVADADNALGVSKSTEFLAAKSPAPAVARGVVYSVNNKDTMGSQFFITLSDSHKESLENNSSYTIIGVVIDGFEAIGAIESDPDLNANMKKSGKPKGKWKSEIWISHTEIHNNPFC